MLNKILMDTFPSYILSIEMELNIIFNNVGVVLSHTAVL